MKRQLVRLIICLASGICWATPVQWSVESGGNGHFYDVVSVPQGINWSDAKTAAELGGGYLVTITSAEENEFVFSLVDDESLWVGNAQGPLLGAHLEAEGWQWVTGEPFIYTNWRLNEPTGGSEEKVVCYTDEDVGSGIRGSYWEDSYEAPQDLYKSYVIETPEPATMMLLGLGGMFLRSRK